MKEMIIVICVLGFCALVTLACLCLPRGKGKIGEQKVAKAIGPTIEGQRYVFNNYILSKDGKSHQIDHIVINARGVFVIETKNYSGAVFGSDGDKTWTLVYGKIKYKKYNPVRQNLTHAKKIRDILTGIPIYSLVVLVQNNTRHIKAQGVIPLKDLDLYLYTGQKVLSPEQMHDAYKKLAHARSMMSSKKHIRNVRKRAKKRQARFCPQCKAGLVKRNGVKGEFYECKRYPLCRYTRKA